MELFFTKNTLFFRGTPGELKEYLENAITKYSTIEELIRLNLN